MATFDQIHCFDYHQRVDYENEDGARYQRLVQLAPYEFMARHPFATDAARVYLMDNDFREQGAKYILKESVAYHLLETMRHTQQYILASANGLSIQDIIERRVPMPTTINQDLLQQLQMPKPMLFNPNIFAANPFQIPGTKENISDIYYSFQDQLTSANAWIEHANYRKDVIEKSGQRCSWVNEALDDASYREVDITGIPRIAFNRAEHLIAELLRNLAPRNIPFHASIAPVNARTQLISAHGSQSTVIVDPSQLRILPIAYSASPVDGPMLLLPGSAAPSIRALRACLIPDEPVPNMAQSPEYIVLSSDEDD